MIRAKEKKERALGERLGIKGERCNSPKCAAVRKPYRPGAHGQSRSRGQVSEYGRQLNEKQKFKVSYGLKERNLYQLFLKASKDPGSTATKLLQLLESRLDNVIFRLGFAPSRSMARQLISHGHILVNKRKARSPGLQVEKGDVISLRPESASKVTFSKLRETLKKYNPPTWLSLDIEKLEGRILNEPKDLEAPFEINLLIESFSK